jgi:hypothetical protein
MSPEPGFYPARRHQRARLALRAWWARQQRPTAASVDYVAVRNRPALSTAGALFMAFLGLSLAAITAARESAALGWHDTEGAGWLALCGVGIVAALLLEFPALRAWFR